MAQDAEKTIDQLNDEADIAADYLEGLLDIVDYEGDIEMGVRNNRPTVQIVADDDTDIKHLIGRNGEVVDACSSSPDSPYSRRPASGPTSSWTWTAI